MKDSSVSVSSGFFLFCHKGLSGFQSVLPQFQSVFEELSTMVAMLTPS